MNKLLVIVFLFLNVCSVFSKESKDEWVLDSAFKRMAHIDNYEQQQKINDTIFNHIYALLDSTKQFALEFDSRRFGRVVSSDQKVCFYSWNYFNRAKGMVLNMIIQTSEGKLYKFQDVSARMPNALEVIRQEDWYGALYYKANLFTIHRKQYYLLLGWTKVDLSTQVKVADVMYFDGDELVFGSPMFTKDTKEFHNRLIFRYDWQVQMSLDYKKKKILFDHLSPMESSYPFEEPRYAPDMSVDSYILKSKYWIYKEDENIKNR